MIVLSYICVILVISIFNVELLNNYLIVATTLVVDGGGGGEEGGGDCLMQVYTRIDK